MKMSTTDGKIILIAETTYDRHPTTSVKPEQVLVIDTIQNYDYRR